MVVPDSPARRTYRTGGTLPELTTSFRPIPIGRDSVGDVDAQVRAFAILLRNRSDRPVYIREGPDTDDAFEISRGEEYRIWEPNGANEIYLRGEQGGETVEVRALEAHNDFNIRDRIDAFARAISHFVGTATRDTNISGQDVDIAIDDAGGLSVTGSVDATIDGSEVTVPIQGSVDANIVNSTLDVDASGSNINADVSGDVNATIDGATVDVPVTGDVNAAITNSQLDVDASGSNVNADVSGDVNATIDGSTVDIPVTGDVNATIDNDSVTITGQVDAELINDIVSISGPVDIQSQSVGDISVVDRTANELNRYGTVEPGAFATNVTGGTAAANYEWVLYENASFDGQIQRIEVRVVPGIEYDAANSAHDFDLGAIGIEGRNYLGGELNYGVDGEGDLDTDPPAGDSRPYPDASNDAAYYFTPRTLRAGALAHQSAEHSSVINVESYQPHREVIMSYEPNNPPTFRVGDTVAIRVRPYLGVRRGYAFTPSETDYDAYRAEIEVMVAEKIQ